MTPSGQKVQFLHSGKSHKASNDVENYVKRIRKKKKKKKIRAFFHHNLKIVAGYNAHSVLVKAKNLMNSPVTVLVLYLCCTKYIQAIYT